MNALFAEYEKDAAEYQVDFREQRAANTTKSRTNRPMSRRRGRAPIQVNGIHRRRTKKIRW